MNCLSALVSVILLTIADGLMAAYVSILSTLTQQSPAEGIAVGMIWLLLSLSPTLKTGARILGLTMRM